MHLIATDVVFLVTMSCLRTVLSVPGYKGDARNYDFTWTSSSSGKSALQEGIRDKLDIPDHISANIHVEHLTNLTLRLVRQRYLSMPSTQIASSDGKIRTTKDGTEDTFFYTDEHGKGSIACQLRKDSQSGKYFCTVSALLSFGNLSCYIGPWMRIADCTQRSSGKRECYRNRTRTASDITRLTKGENQEVVHENQFVENTTRSTRNGLLLPEPGYKTVELSLVVDAKFMELFYMRHPSDPAAGQKEAVVYLVLLSNEINVFYDSLREATGGNFVLFVYPTQVIIPKYTRDFRWSSRSNDGKILYANQEMDDLLWSFVRAVSSSRQTDHIMAITGISLCNHCYGVHWLHNQLVNSADPDETAPAGAVSSGSSLFTGYAYSNTMCTGVSWKYSVIEFGSIDVSATAAHELGHALGAKHDGNADCPTETHVMSANAFYPTTATRNTYYKFSRCSLRDIRMHLKRYPSCTRDNSFTDKQFRRAFCAGFLGSQHASLDLQCQRQTGYAGSTACDRVADDTGCYRPGRVRCRNRNGKCTTMLTYVWNGTPCGKNKMCFKGRCTRAFEVCS